MDGKGGIGRGVGSILKMSLSSMLLGFNGVHDVCDLVSVELH